ncbi:unnamed protein product [Nesidiocoris tenuis]|uniref:Uncharacterized protein n=1 Tax=Nesidiocoris tenuis TaxID=355587 RepID=A0A6H5FVP2_9HEMI|nr:unnamed protein product [Nesidiocoris tenuis]
MYRRFELECCAVKTVRGFERCAKRSQRQKRKRKGTVVYLRIDLRIATAAVASPAARPGPSYSNVLLFNRPYLTSTRIYEQLDSFPSHPIRVLCSHIPPRRVRPLSLSPLATFRHIEFPLSSTAGPTRRLPGSLYGAYPSFRCLLGILRAAARHHIPSACRNMLLC